VYSGCEAAGHSFWFTTDQGLWHGDGQHLQRVVVQTPGGKSPASLAFEVLACDGTGGAWLGGGDAGGLWQLRQRGPGWEIAQAMPPHLENLLVVGLLHDRRGWLWASTDAGVHVWNGLRWRSFNRDNGLVWNDANLNALYEDADGSIWVGTSRGAQHITQPEAIFETVQRTAPVLTMARGEQVIDVAAPVALAWAGPPLKLSFASPWFEGRRAESFHYRVLGLDDVWAVSASAELTLSSLAPGDYRLEVVSENADRQTRSPVASVSFSIHAPWWRTPAFYALCLLALAALAWGLHRWRMGQQAQRQRYLEGLVALHARDEAWRAVVEHSADGIVRYDRQCRRIYANPAIRATYDFPTDQVLNKTASEASSLPADQALALVRAIRQVLESGQPQEMEVWYASPLDERHWGHMRLVPEFAQDGRVASVLAVTRDITSIKKTEAHLRQSQLLLRQLAARNETVRDDERKHLAREIHDELGQQLLALRMGVSVLDIQFGSVNPVLRARTLRLTEIVDSTIKVVRNVVTSLRPNALDMGIVSALEWLVGEAFAEAGIEFDLQVRENDIQLDDARATAIFRITQESLTNIVRHAHATRVTVRLERRDTNYWLEIRDNGCGFDPALRKESAFGLVSIRERGHMLGGSVEIASAPGEATSIRVAFPIHNIAHGGAS
jgi:PAS domain S-box-containing protein